MKCPAQVYSASPRPYAGLPELSYPLHDREVLVTACGASACTASGSTSPPSWPARNSASKEVDDGVWLVSFMRYDLGFIDLEQKTLQPLDSPFGPRLSPMS